MSKIGTITSAPPSALFATTVTLRYLLRRALLHQLARREADFVETIFHNGEACNGGGQLETIFGRYHRYFLWIFKGDNKRSKRECGSRANFVLWMSHSRVCHPTTMKLAARMPLAIKRVVGIEFSPKLIRWSNLPAVFFGRSVFFEILKESNGSFRIYSMASMFCLS